MGPLRRFGPSQGLCLKWLPAGEEGQEFGGMRGR